MIEDKARPPRPTARDWAVFRYGLISEATRPLADEVTSDILARIAARQHQLPDGSLRAESRTLQASVTDPRSPRWPSLITATRLPIDRSDETTNVMLRSAQQQRSASRTVKRHA